MKPEWISLFICCVVIAYQLRVIIRQSRMITLMCPNRVDVAAAIAKLEEIVCTEGCDAGVVLLSEEGPTHQEVWGGKPVRVYDHEYFSPLGDALIALYKILKGESDATSKEDC